MVGYLARNLALLCSCVIASEFGSFEFSGNASGAQAGTPFNEELARYRLKGANGEDEYLAQSFVETSCGSKLNVHYTEPKVWGSETGSATRPILILTHGYPESSYIWRDVAPSISARLPVFIPDQPGYGLSTSCCKSNECAYDKRTYAKAIMEAVRETYGNVHVVYAGHDRGARTMHRAAVDNNFEGIIGLGFFAADIVPFVVEYSSFSNPFWAQNYFHWSLLPKGEFATDMIMAYGGDKFTHQLLEWGSGSDPDATGLFKSGNAWEVYENFFSQRSVVNASVFDYVAGATTDYEYELHDQDNGIKVKIPAHVMYSIRNLGSTFDVEAVWKNYTDPGAAVVVEGIGDGRGHFIIEEAPHETIEQLNAFLDRLGVAN